MHLKITDAPYFVKIPIRLKIPASLKISVQSKNLYLKISVRCCSGAICPEFCKGIQGLRRGCGTHDHDTTIGGEQESHKGRATKKFFCLYIGIIAPNQKYLQKKLKKVWKFNFLPYLCSRNQTTNKFNNKIKAIWTLHSGISTK